MILHELCGRNEAHPLYRKFEAENGARHYDFLRSFVEASLTTGKPFLSGHLIKALNFHAITCLHVSPGEYRPCQVKVGSYTPPEHYLVHAYMEEMVNEANRAWESTDPLVLAAWVLWRLNFIHPFINGNGRTARAAAYFVICVQAQGWLPGNPILPELLRQNRDEYVTILGATDASYLAGALDLSMLRGLLERLLGQQLAPFMDTSAAATPASTSGTPALPPPP